jgi:hypothetical protein
MAWASGDSPRGLNARAYLLHVPVTVLKDAVRKSINRPWQRPTRVWRFGKGPGGRIYIKGMLDPVDRWILTNVNNP